MTTHAPMPGIRYRPGAYTRRPAEITPELEGKIAWRREAASEPFRGITAPGGIRPGLFPVRETGVDVTGMRAAARDYLAALPAGQRAEGRAPMDDVTWRHWANGARWFLRHGLLLEDLADADRDRAMALMRSCLSEAGFSQIVTLMRLNRTIGEIRGEEDLLNEWMYWFTVYGEPESGKPWGWQLDGHHVCVNCVLAGDQMVLTPTFLGAEPVTAETGKFKGLTSFREEEAVGQRLLLSLNGSQRARAVIADEMPADLFTGAFRDNYELGYEGLPLGDMDAGQRAIAAELLGVYTGRANTGHAAVRMEEIRAFEDETYFSWIGDPDGVFYYRLHSPVIIAEFEHMSGVMFDNDEPLRIHIHTVVRTPNGGDYGVDLLRAHHERYVHLQVRDGARRARADRPRAQNKEHDMKVTVGRDDLALAAVAGAESAGTEAGRVVVEPVTNAADGFVNDGDADICEVPVVTLLQAVALGRPVLLLPVTALGRHQHQTLVTRGDRGVGDLEGRTVGVRSWSQTTGVWVRGVLAEQYGVDLRKVNWKVYEASHVVGHQDPDWVTRAPQGRKLPADFLAGEVDFGIMGRELPKAEGIRTVLPDPDAAAEAWSRANGFNPVNHVVGVTEQAAREHPAAVLAAYDAMVAAAQAAAAGKPGSGAFHPTGFAGLRGPAGRAAQYAGDQLVLARPVEFDELVEATCKALGVPPARLGG